MQQPNEVRLKGEHLVELDEDELEMLGGPDHPKFPDRLALLCFLLEAQANDAEVMGAILKHFGYVRVQ